MPEETTIEIENLELSKYNYYFETPLYEMIDINSLEKNTFTGEVDAYSAKNTTDTTYSVAMEAIDTWTEWSGSSHISVGFYLITLKCKRKDNDVLRFFIYLNKVKAVTMKVGQFPSLADLQFVEIGKKYDKVLPHEDLRNLKKAIGLAAHGAGAGSFVYLRRIFENLIQETFDNAKELGVTNVVFKTKRMEDKIDLLKEYLPSQLVEMKVIYGILSRGVHKLSEDECRKYFLPLKLSIELILDQKIEEKKKKGKDTEVKGQLQSIIQELGVVKKPDEK